MPWTSLCCSELHRCFPVFLPVGQPGAPASSTRLPTWFIIGQQDVVTLQPVYSLGEWQFSRGFATMLQCFLVRTATHCGSFRNDDILKCPEQFCSLYSLRTCFLERYTATALVLWQMQWQFLHSSVFCMLLSFADTAKLAADCDHTTDGCISPMKLGACSPVWFVVGDGMFGSRSLAFFASSLSLLAPPSRGVLISLTIGFVIAADSQEDDYYVHEGPLRADLRGLWERFRSSLLSCTARLMLGLTSELSLHVCLGSCDT